MAWGQNLYGLGRWGSDDLSFEITGLEIAVNLGTVSLTLPPTSQLITVSLGTVTVTASATVSVTGVTSQVMMGYEGQFSEYYPATSTTTWIEI